MRPKTSEVWKYFEKVDNKKAKCKNCFKCISSSGNTSNLKKHFHSKSDEVPTKKHKLAKDFCETNLNITNALSLRVKSSRSCTSQNSDEPSTSSNPDIPDESGTIKNFDLSHTTGTTYTSSTAITNQPSLITTFHRQLSYSVNVVIYFLEGRARHMYLTKCLLYFICKDQTPFDIVNGKGFKHFIKQLAPSFKIPSVDTLKNNLNSLYTMTIERYRLQFQDTASVNHIALTCDIWSDMMTARSFIGITSHFLFGINMRTKILAMQELEDRHTSTNIKSHLTDICQKMGINNNKIVAIVTDNGSNMINASVLFFDETRHLRCFTHTLNLIVKEALKSETIKIISKIRNIVKYFKASVLKSKLLKDKQLGKQFLKLILDVKTRWNSTFYMLKKYIELANIVHGILLENKIKAPKILTALEVKTAKEYLSILKPAEYVTKDISGEKYVTLSKNPRFKALHFLNPQSYTRALSYIRKEIEMNDKSVQSESDSEGHSESSISPNKYDFWTTHKKLAHNSKRKRKFEKNLTENRSAANDKLSIYLGNPVVFLSTNPIVVWEEMRNVFPSLYKLARKYLLIPATSVSAERLFSKAGNTLTKNRNRLVSTEYVLDIMQPIPRNEYIFTTFNSVPYP
ncbi:E3 SUMO-protein ligase ZBED1-like [Cardiocondyla obscurior]|uniref:E3 SUMO-protein ligase ZBED1-like n=1 Tax=Cardiocondyla obscurior TaxID=286306 RepID=UPI0039656884